MGFTDGIDEKQKKSVISFARKKQLENKAEFPKICKDVNCFTSFCEAVSLQDFNSISKDRLERLEALYVKAFKFGQALGFTESTEYINVGRYLKDYYSSMTVDSFEEKYNKVRCFSSDIRSKPFLEEEESLFDGSWKIIEEEVVEENTPF